jgi:hypothetical protein
VATSHDGVAKPIPMTFRTHSLTSSQVGDLAANLSATTEAKRRRSAWDGKG